MSSIRVMTFNIRHGRGMDGIVDLRRIAQVIEEQRVDIVALNEVDSLTERSGGVRQAEYLGELLNMEAVFGPSIPYQGGEYGNAVLSRFPLRLRQVHHLPNGEGEIRTLLHTAIAWHDETVHFLVTHLGLNASEQTRQLTAITNVLDELSGPKIVAGDFNFDVQQMEGPHVFPAVMRDVCEDAPQPTFPSDDPKARIDYIFVSEELRVKKEFRVVHTEVSDHLPIVGDIELVKA